MSKVTDKLIDQAIKGAITAYNIKSDGDTEYLLKELIRAVLGILMRSI